MQDIKTSGAIITTLDLDSEHLEIDAESNKIVLSKKNPRTLRFGYEHELNLAIIERYKQDVRVVYVNSGNHSRVLQVGKDGIQYNGDSDDMLVTVDAVKKSQSSLVELKKSVGDSYSVYKESLNGSEKLKGWGFWTSLSRDYVSIYLYNSGSVANLSVYKDKIVYGSTRDELAVEKDLAPLDSKLKELLKRYEELENKARAKGVDI